MQAIPEHVSEGSSMAVSIKWVCALKKKPEVQIACDVMKYVV